MGEDKNEQDECDDSIEGKISDTYEIVHKKSSERLQAAKPKDILFSETTMKKLLQYIGTRLDDFEVDADGDTQFFYIDIGDVTIEMYTASFSGTMQVVQLTELTDGLKRGIYLRSVEYEKGYKFEFVKWDRSQRFIVLSEGIGVEKK